MNKILLALALIVAPLLVQAGEEEDMTEGHLCLFLQGSLSPAILIDSV